MSNACWIKDDFLPVNRQAMFFCFFALWSLAENEASEKITISSSPSTLALCQGRPSLNCSVRALRYVLGMSFLGPCLASYPPFIHTCFIGLNFLVFSLLLRTLDILVPVIHNFLPHHVRVCGIPAAFRSSPSLFLQLSPALDLPLFPESS